MKILVTGGAGFIGSHTIVELLNQDYEVICVDNFCNSKREVVSKIKDITKKDFAFYECDICKYEEFSKVFEKEKIDCVIHFAALKSGADSISNPGLYYYNNIESTRVLLRLMKEHGVKKIIYSSSATVYGNNQNCPIKESEPTGNVISPYGMTKYINELILKDVAENEKDIKAIAFRYFNPVGAHPSGIIGEDSPDEIPNNLMLYLLMVANKELPFLRIFGNDYNTPDGSGIRDYIHVVDVALGHVAAVKYFDKMNDNYDVFNLGTGKGHTVLELVNTFEKVNGVKVPYEIAPRRPGDVEISFASVSKAEEKMGWVATKNLEDCLKDSWNFKLKKKK